MAPWYGSWVAVSDAFFDFAADCYLVFQLF